jgi:putative phosphoesterase
MRIAVVADSHDRLPDGLLERVQAADEIWHLGDVCAPMILDEFLALGKPLQVVRGNCDECDEWPPTLELQRERLKFFLIHIPPYGNPPGVNALLHGHTHVPRDEMRDGVRWLNPGSVSRPRNGGPTFAWLTVTDGKLTSWELVRV